MSFKEQYTTSELVLAEASIDPKDLLQKDVFEKDKVILSNDFYMLGQYLECLINRMVK